VLICCANQKGGVGKTTTAVNLAVCLARQTPGRVLAVDCDPQATMTRQLGVDLRATALTLVDVLAGRVAAADATLSDVVAGVDVIAGARELSGVEMALVGEIGRERFLADALEPLRDAYATIVFDTPPNLGLLTVNALLCADVILAPVSCEDEGSVQGLVELRSTVSRLDRLRDRTPELMTLLTRWVSTRVLSQVIEQTLSGLDLAPVAKVPARAAVGQAGAEHIPLTVSAPDSCVAMAYEQLVSRLTTARVLEPEGALR
jgi:chromosome partitioning protein